MARRISLNISFTFIYSVFNPLDRGYRLGIQGCGTARHERSAVGPAGAYRKCHRTAYLPYHPFRQSACCPGRY